MRTKNIHISTHIHTHMYAFWFISINLHEIYQRTHAHTPPGPDRIPARIQISSSAAAATATTRVQRTLSATGAQATTHIFFIIYFIHFSFALAALCIRRRHGRCRACDRCLSSLSLCTTDIAGLYTVKV